MNQPDPANLNEPFGDSEQLPPAEAQPVAWVAEVAKRISQYGLSEEAAAVFAASEVDEYRAGLCDCAEHSPEDMADLMMAVAADAVDKWKSESVGRVWGYKPPSAPVGVEGVRREIQNALRELDAVMTAEDNTSDAVGCAELALQRALEALAQQPAALDGAWTDIRDRLPPNGERVEVRATSVRTGGRHSTTWAIGTTNVTHWRALAAQQGGGTDE